MRNELRGIINSLNGRELEDVYEEVRSRIIKVRQKRKQSVYAIFYAAPGSNKTISVGAIFETTPREALNRLPRNHSILMEIKLESYPGEEGTMYVIQELWLQHNPMWRKHDMPRVTHLEDESYIR